MEVGMCHADRCDFVGVSRTHVIQGVVCPHMLSTGRAVGAGTIVRDRHSDCALNLSLAFCFRGRDCCKAFCTAPLGCCLLEVGLFLSCLWILNYIALQASFLS